MGEVLRKGLGGGRGPRLPRRDDQGDREIWGQTLGTRREYTGVPCFGVKCGTRVRSGSTVTLSRLPGGQEKEREDSCPRGTRRVGYRLKPPPEKYGNVLRFGPPYLFTDFSLVGSPQFTSLTSVVLPDHNPLGLVSRRFPLPVDRNTGRLTRPWTRHGSGPDLPGES